MKISVFGLGYVGCITAACLAYDGHTVVGVDVNRAKVSAINDGQNPVAEPGLLDMIQSGRSAGLLTATSDAERAIGGSEMALVCVGTPSQPSGNLDPHYVLRVCQQIGSSLVNSDGDFVVVMRSTVLPDTFDQCRAVLAQASGEIIGRRIGLVANPEFLREGSGIQDFFHPPLTVVGQEDLRSGDMVAALYCKLPGRIIRTDTHTAMMVKYASNAFHALKVVFANEIGALCKRLDLDGQEMMNIFCQDRSLNISDRYLKPGFAFGGSCLPKDLRALTYLARHNDLRVPVLESILPSNQAQFQAALDLILNGQCRKVGLLGLSFKPHTDDLRESPMVQLAESLLGKGYELKIYDANICPDRLVGSNRAYVEEAIPHLSVLLCDTLEEVVSSSEVLVASHCFADGEAETLVNLTPDKRLVDLVNVLPEDRRPVDYEGICW